MRKDSELLEILLFFLVEIKEFKHGLCVLSLRLKQNKIITKEEHAKILDLIMSYMRRKYSLSISGYMFEKGQRYPRIKALEEMIKEAQEYEEAAKTL